MRQLESQDRRVPLSMEKGGRLEERRGTGEGRALQLGIVAAIGIDAFLDGGSTASVSGHLSALLSRAIA